MKRQDQQVAAAAIVEDGRWLGRLRDELRGLLAPVFCQARSRFTAFAYVDALLAEPGDRRSCWQLAERAGHATPRRMQALLAGHCWDWKAALGSVQRFILDHLGDPGAILVLDETAELKQGQMTVGVARQHAGITGQVENCQTVVNCAYVSALGHALYDFRLYLPRGWCEDTSRRERAQVPRDVEFKTKTELGTQMITGAISAGTPFGWAAGDEVYGRSGKLRQACEDAGKGYVLAVPRDFKVRLHPRRGKARADAAARRVPAAAWETRSCGRGCKGHRDYQWAWLAIARLGTGCCCAAAPPTLLTSHFSTATSPRPAGVPAAADHRRREEMAGGGVSPAGKGAARLRPAPGPAVAVLPPPHRAVPVRAGAAGRCRRPPGSSAINTSDRQHPGQRRRPARKLG